MAISSLHEAVYGKFSFIEITPYDATLGAFVTDVNLGEELDDVTFASIETVWHERGVLTFS